QPLYLFSFGMSSSNKLKRKAAPPSSGSSAPASAPSSSSGSTEPPPLVPASKRLEADVDFVCSAIETRSSQGDYQLARCHLALAKCLWRDSFKVRRWAYQLARDEADWDAAAAAFMQMYAENPNEALFYQELSRVLEGVTKADGDAASTALFGRLPGRLQCELLLKYGQSVGSALEQAGLLLYAIQQYPSVAAQQGSSLVEALLAAEQDSCEDTVLNKHRKCLVVDVLPVLLDGANASSGSVQLSSKLLRKLLTMSMEFYVAVGSAQQQQQALLDSWQLSGNSWPVAGRQLADRLCHQLGLQLHQLARGQPDSVLSAAASSELDSNQIKSLAAVSLLLLAEAANRFYRLARQQSGSTSPTPPTSPQSVTSATAHQGIDASNLESASSSHAILLLHCLRPVADKLQMPTVSIARREASKAFLSASNIVWLIRDWPELQRRIDSIKDRLQRRGAVRLAWLDSIVSEHLLYIGQPAACLKELRLLASGPGAWPTEHRLYYEAQCLQLQGAMAASVRPLLACCQALSPSDGSLISLSSPAPAISLADAQPPAAAPCLAPLTCGLALRLLVATLADLLVGLASRADSSSDAPDCLIGHCLVLLQRDWPDEETEGQQQRQHQLDALLNLIRGRSSFNYCPQFADYVILPETIEELALLHNSAGIELNLFPPVNADEKKPTAVGFDAKMAAQMDRCHDNLAELLYRFVRAEEKSLLEFVDQADFSE
ncbi:hypothetical protein BOX15_Mlig022440g1, partial [Macrostomum lignano]